MTTRARDLGVPFGGMPGAYNAITDVDGVEVGHFTSVSDQHARADGTGLIRTGVTIIHPRGRFATEGVLAGRATLNGTGEWTGMHLVDEIGRFHGPIALTGTGNLGIVHRALVEWSSSLGFLDQDERYMRLLAIVGETLDAHLNDVFSAGLQSSDVFQALNAAVGGPIAEGNVGGGTGMVAYEFKGGIGTASRVIASPRGEFTVGALVQANHARRADLVIAGVPVGVELDAPLPHVATSAEWAADARRSESIKNSLLMVLATDAPLMPHQLQRLARRAPLGVGRNGSTANNLSGELALAFSTANPKAPAGYVDDLDSDTMNALFAAAVQSVEESLVNQLVASADMVGNGGVKVHALPHRALSDMLRRYGR
jgi:L-aminopeptidase/D-esterase-like protein